MHANYCGVILSIVCARESLFENDRFLHSHWQMSPSGLVLSAKPSYLWASILSSFFLFLSFSSFSPSRHPVYWWVNRFPSANKGWETRGYLGYLSNCHDGWSACTGISFRHTYSITHRGIQATHDCHCYLNAWASEGYNVLTFTSTRPLAPRPD